MPYDKKFILPFVVIKKTLMPDLIYHARLGHNYRQLFSRITPTL